MRKNGTIEWPEGVDTKNWVERTVAARRPKSSSERVRKHRAKGYEIGPIPEIKNAERRESCKFDLLKFGLTYAREFLDHDPSDKMVRTLIKPIESAILHGGQELVMFPRSTGKTTWIKIAIKWALAYGHKRFIVIIAATGGMSGNIFDEMLDAMAGGTDAFEEDFPYLQMPIDALDGNKKGAFAQLANGQKTDMLFKATRFTLPSAKNFDGKTVEPSAGSVLVSCSMGGAIKGLVNKKERPDMYFLDDPQTEKMARSVGEVDKAESFIVGSVLGLGGQTKDATALMAVTPIQYGDLVTRFTDKRKYGDWHVSCVPYVEGWTKRHDDLFVAYQAARNEDVSIDDKTFALSKRFYLDHKDEFAGLDIIDPLNFTPSEIDAVHHLLNMKVKYKEHFDAEFQMKVTNEAAGEALEPETVRSNVTNYPRHALPPGLFKAVAFCDVNVTEDAGLRFGVAGFGPNRVVSLIDRGRYPESGRLYPENASPEQKEEAIIKGIKAVVGYLRRAPYYRFDNGERIHLTAIAFDGGFEMRTVYSSLVWIGRNVNMGGTALYMTRGFGWSQYKSDIKGVMEVKDHIHHASSVMRDGTAYQFLAVHADYWREVMQKAYRIKYPQRGSFSLFGDKTTNHVIWSEEVTYEKLVRTYRDERTLKKAWQFVNDRPGHNHSADISYNLLAVAHFCGLYTALAPVDVGTVEEEPVKENAAPVKENAAPVKENVAPVKQIPVQVKRNAVKNHSIFKRCRRSGGGGHSIY